jgi:hypothetical protein
MEQRDRRIHVACVEMLSGVIMYPGGRKVLSFCRARYRQPERANACWLRQHAAVNFG